MLSGAIECSSSVYVRLRESVSRESEAGQDKQRPIADSRSLIADNR